MIVRELIAVLGIELDDRDVKKVDGAVSKFEGRMQDVGRAIGGTIFLAGLARAAGAVVRFASDAEETLNLVRETFGANAAEVEAWSLTVAKEVGRSEFLMREMAGTLGAVLTPMMEGNTQASADMSTSLATLAVDLGSFFNAAESDVLIALRAGIVGETEPMRRFGVVMLESTLQAFALAQGITKTVKSMSIAEKTTLRFQFIMSQTSIAQGDAARTADGFANASRAAADGIKDLATRIGGQLLPVASRFMVWARDSARSLTEVFQKTNILQSGLIVLAGALAVAGVLLLAPFVGFLVVAAKVIAVVAVLTAVGDELITLFKGGTTVIGEFIDSMFGIGATQVVIDAIKDGWVLMGEAMDDSIIKLGEWRGAMESDMEAAGAAVFDFTSDFQSDMAVAGEAFDSFFDDVAKRFPAFAEGMSSAGKAIGDFGADASKTLGTALSDIGKATGLAGAGGVLSNAFSADTFNELRTRRTAVGQGIDSASVGARRGSTSARLRLSRARQLEDRRRLTGADRKNLARLEAKDTGTLKGENLSESERRQLSGLRTKRSTGRRLESEKLTKDQQLELSRITDPAVERRQRATVNLSATERRQSVEAAERQAVTARRPREFARATAATAPATQSVMAPTINANITINEATNPDAVTRAVNKGIADAVADAGAAVARGVR